jgi:hypothetical protein
MAVYKITGVVYDEKGDCWEVNYTGTIYAEYDAVRQHCEAFPIYRIVCSAQEGQVIARKEFVKTA